MRVHNCWCFINLLFLLKNFFRCFFCKVFKQLVVVVWTLFWFTGMFLFLFIAVNWFKKIFSWIIIVFINFLFCFAIVIKMYVMVLLLGIYFTNTHLSGYLIVSLLLTIVMISWSTSPFVFLILIILLITSFTIIALITGLWSSWVILNSPWIAGP